MADINKPGPTNLSRKPTFRVGNLNTASSEDNICHDGDRNLLPNNAVDINGFCVTPYINNSQQPFPSSSAMQKPVAVTSKIPGPKSSR